MEWFVFVIVVVIIYMIAKRFTKKEAKQFFDENAAPKEAQNIDTVDPTCEVLVMFKFKSKNDQFMINSFPNIIINNTDKYKLIDDMIILKLPPNFHVHFGVPYMKGEAFKANENFNFQVGHKYEILFKPKVTVFQKAKVTVEDVGSI